LFDLAASYGFGIVKNHAFVDGNKRTGFTVAVLFLELNGVFVDAAEADATVQTLALAAGAIKERAYAEWLRKNSKRRR
jgi:death-on-curing protein